VNLAALAQASYVGGGAADNVVGVSLAPSAGTFAGDVFVGGSTSSANLSGTTGAAQPAYTGSGDAFAAAITPALEGPEVTLNLAVNSLASVAVKKEFKTTIVVTNASPTGNDASNVVVNDVLTAFGSTASISYVSTIATQGNCNQIGGVVVCSLGALSANGGSAQITITAKAGRTRGDVTSDITTHSDQALDPASINEVLQKTTITKAPASGGGGAFGWPLLLLLAAFAIGVTILRRRRYRQPG
jgi:hypothetical protein